MAEQFLTVEQAAKRLQVHPYTLRRYLREGKIRAVKISRHYRIAESDLKFEIASQLKSPPDRAAILQAARDSLRGAFGTAGAVDRFLAEKHAETAREERLYQENLNERLAGWHQGKAK